MVNVEIWYVYFNLIQGKSFCSDTENNLCSHLLRICQYFWRQAFTKTMQSNCGSCREVHFFFSFFFTAPINSCLNVVVRCLTPFGLSRNGCWPSRGSQLPWTLPFIFLLCCPLNDRRRATHSFFKIGHLFSLFSGLSLARPRLLILLLLLMSGNVHPNLGPIFPCAVCAGNVTWRGKSVQCCTCSKWGYLRCSQLFLSKFRALGSSHSWSFPPAVTPHS